MLPERIFVMQVFTGGLKSKNQSPLRMWQAFVLNMWHSAYSNGTLGKSPFFAYIWVFFHLSSDSKWEEGLWQ